jgi:hypothetical protein
MASATFFRRQAATCATLAKETHDEESRERCLWLEQTYLHLAETEEQGGARTGARNGDEGKLAT